MSLQQSFNLEPASVASSRQFVGGTVTDLPTGVQEAVVLMVSELATNAIVHAATGFEVSVARTDSSLRVEVTDVGGGKPELRAPSATEPRGRGLQIVKALSDEWGVTEMTGKRGKTVWFGVRLPPAQEDGRARLHQQGSVRASKRRSDVRRPSARGRSENRSGGPHAISIALVDVHRAIAGSIDSGDTAIAA